MIHFGKAFLIASAIFIAVTILYPLTNTTIRDVKTREMNDVDQLAVALKAFNEEYGHFPKGTNKDVIRQISSDNPRKIIFLEVDSKELNSNKEMIDRWGTPYLIEIDEKIHLPRVSSAGKNKIFEPNLEKSDDIKSWH